MKDDNHKASSSLGKRRNIEFEMIEIPYYKKCEYHDPESKNNACKKYVGIIVDRIQQLCVYIGNIFIRCLGWDKPKYEWVIQSKKNREWMDKYAQEKRNEKMSKEVEEARDIIDPNKKYTFQEVQDFLKKKNKKDEERRKNKGKEKM